jgi:hypothetical protein
MTETMTGPILWTQKDTEALTKLVRFEEEIVRSAGGGLWDAMELADQLANSSAGVTDKLLADNLQSLFSELATAPMSYHATDRATFLELYIAAAFGRWSTREYAWNPADSIAPHDFFKLFLHTATDAWRPPHSPSSWTSALQPVLDFWDYPRLPPEKLCVTRALVWGEITNHQRDVLATTKWINTEQPPAPIANAIKAQADAVRTMGKDGLTPDACITLLFFFASILLGATAEHDLAKRLAAAKAPSDEYPDASFPWQLVYKVAMTLVDPLGEYSWSHDKVRAQLQAVRELFRGTDDLSKAMVDAIAYHLQVFDADTNYPIEDPYSSETFPVRQADTLYALNSIWKKP